MIKVTLAIFLFLISFSASADYYDIVTGEAKRNVGTRNDALSTAIDENGNADHITVDALNHLDVLPHGHDEGGHIFFEKTFTSADGAEDFILIDISDTTTWPHSNTTWIHFGNLIIDVDAGGTSAYHFEIGFIDNVDGTNGDYHPLYNWSGSKSTGNQIREVIATNPESAKGKSDSSLATGVSLNDTAFQTDVNLGSTIDPETIDISSGNGDIVLRVIANSGADWNLSIVSVYHSH